MTVHNFIVYISIVLDFEVLIRPLIATFLLAFITLHFNVESFTLCV